MRNNRINTGKIELTDEQRQMLMNEIHEFFLTEYGDDFGIIKQQHILDMFMEQLAPIVIIRLLMMPCCGIRG